MLKRTIVLSLVCLSIAVAGCRDDYRNADDIDRQQQEQQLKQAQQQTGLPNIVNYTEKKLAKMLLELRDEQVPTYSYISNQSGLYFICNSIGYGIPYATQVTNPEKEISNAYGLTTLPQAEPNGLFMPSSADASWAICSDGKGKIVPVYVEAHLVISPFKLNATGTWGAAPSIQNESKTKELKIK